jgi:tRNA(Ile)-lysidine synthase
MTRRSRAAKTHGSSHPPALMRRTERTLREETPLARGDHVVVAVSGGGDSTALLHVLARLAPRFGIQLSAHGVDHGLRPGAAAELDLIEQLARELGVPFARSRLDVQPGGNLQARARTARYAALDRAAELAGARWVATAHHADDRAETVLMRILRGTGPRGLAVLPAASERRLRPLIRSPRTAITEHLARHRLSYSTDPSNGDPRFLRSRIRHELLPALELLAPGAARHLNQLADECAEAEPVVVTDAQGQPVSLLGSQIAQIRRARKLNKSNALIWLSGGLELAPTGSNVAHGPEAGTGPKHSRRNPRPSLFREQNTAGRGAKPTKSD